MLQEYAVTRMLPSSQHAWSQQFLQLKFSKIYLIYFYCLYFWNTSSYRVSEINDLLSSIDNSVAGKALKFCVGYNEFVGIFLREY